MSRKTKRRAYIWNNYICPCIEIAAHALFGLAAVIGLYITVVALILVF